MRESIDIIVSLVVKFGVDGRKICSLLGLSHAPKKLRYQVLSIFTRHGHDLIVQ